MMLHMPHQAYHGYHGVVGPDNGHLRLLTFALLKLGPGEQYDGDTGDYEQVFVLMSGTMRMEVSGQIFEGQRCSVFEDRATAVYLPRATHFHVTNGGPGTLEAGIAGTPADVVYAPFIVKPDEIGRWRVGQSNWARTVQDIVVKNGDGRVHRIVVGETINDPGNWSGYPPHKHDTAIPDLEADMEELYHYRVSPAQGFGAQLRYTKDPGHSEAYVVRDGDSFLIPDGYHPVAAGAGYRLYYLWMMAGNIDRQLLPHEDPAHVWVNE